MLLMICFGKPAARDRKGGELVGATTVLDSAPSRLRNSTLYRHCWPSHTAIAVGVAEGHQHLAAAVVPHDAEVGAGDGEPVDGVVRALAVRSPSRRATCRAARRRGRGWRDWGSRSGLSGPGGTTTAALAVPPARTGGGARNLSQAGQGGSVIRAGRPLTSAVDRRPGRSGVSPVFDAAGGWTAAAAPVQGWAKAGGATPMATVECGRRRHR